MSIYRLLYSSLEIVMLRYDRVTNIDFTLMFLTYFNNLTPNP